MDADASKTALQHIERIRRDKYGLGGDGQTTNPLAGDMHQAVALLAQGLYQKETHFILELIQNAEDNSYPEGQEPQLLFSLAAGDPTATGTPVEGANMTLGLFNNEVGFREENVDALCSVGMSTKKDKSFGYIGEKGIGFKSVFVVSKTPCVISNGYRFCFDEDVDPAAQLGYIVPTWLPAEHPSATQLQDMGAPAGTRTAILLPLKAAKAADVQRQLAELAPETILFLRKLRSLVILDKVHNKTIGVAKHRAPYPALPVFELQTPHARPTTYLLREGAWMVPPGVKEEKRVGVDVWRVTVAFPLDDTPPADRADVYAFLPTEVHSGWPFLINADFLLTASRESIAFGTPWNQGLLGCTRAAFVEGYLEIQNVSAPLPVFGGGAAPSYEVLRFLPVRTATPKLEPLRQQMVAELATKPVVPLAPIAAPPAPVTFCEPARARIVRPGFLSLLDTAVRGGATLPALLQAGPPAADGLGLVHPDAAARFPAQLAALGVKQASAAEYTAIFADPGFLSSLSDEAYVSLLLLLLDAAFPAPDLVPLAKADALRFVDPATGAVHHGRSTLQKPIYLPPKATQDAWLLQEVARLQPLAPVRLLAPSFYAALSASPRAVELVEWLRKILQVKDLSVASYAEQVLQVAKTLRDAAPLLAATDFFVAAHAAHADTDLANLALADLPLVAETGAVLLRWAAPGAEKGTAAVGSKMLLLPRDVADWPALLDGDKAWAERCVKLHPAYLGSNPDQRAPRIAFLRTHLAAVDLAHIQPPAGTGLACLDKARATRKGLPHAAARALVKWLAVLVAAKDGREATWARGRDGKPSTFATLCKEAPWMPTSLKSRRPAETFMRSDAVVRLLGDSLPFVVEGVATPGDIDALKWLGVRVEVTPDDVAAHIRALARGPASAVDLTSAQKLYGYLAANSWTLPIRRADEGGPLPVWLPAGVGGRAEAQWRPVEACVWEGVDRLFAGQFACLSDVYRRPFQDFFEKMGVLPTPPVSCYMRAWLLACAGGAALGRDRGVDGPCADLELAESVWTKLAADYRDVKLQEEWEEFKRSGLVPVTARTPAEDADESAPESGWQDGMPPSPKKPAKQPKLDFVRLKPGVEAFIPDDLNLEKLFSEAHPGLPVAWQPGAVSGPALPSLFAIYHEMGAGFFTTASTLIVTPSGRTVALPLPRGQAASAMEAIKPVIGRSLMLAVMGFLSSQAHGAGPEFQDANVRHACLLPLVEAAEVAVEKLEVTYRLRNAAGDVVAQVEGSRRCHWAKEQKTLFRALEADDPLKGGRRAQRGSGELETAVDIVKAVARAVIDERLGNRAEVVARLEDFLLPFAMQGLYNKDYLTRELLLKKNVRINAVDEAWILSGAFTVDDLMSEDEDEGINGWGEPQGMNGQAGKAWEGDSAMSEGPLPEEGYAPSASGRTSGSRTCFKCGEEGHISRDCPMGAGRLCFKCGEEGHIARDCQSEQFGGNGRGMLRDRQSGPLRDDWAQQLRDDEAGPSSKYDREMLQIDARQFVARQYGSLREYIAAQAGGGDQTALEICNQLGYSPVTVPKKPVELRKDARAALTRPDNTPPERSARVSLPDEVLDRLRWWTAEHLPQVRTKLGFAASQEAGAAAGQELGDGMLDRCLTLAFLHESYLGVRLPSYERLEFLGDAWLNAVISSRLFELHPRAHEGLLSEMRAALTRNAVNALYLRALALDGHVILNEATPSVKDEYGTVRDDICADVLEAIIGAVFYAFGPKGPFMVYKLINEKITPKLLGA